MIKNNFLYGTPLEDSACLWFLIFTINCLNKYHWSLKWGRIFWAESHECLKITNQKCCYIGMIIPPNNRILLGLKSVSIYSVIIQIFANSAISKINSVYDL